MTRPETEEALTLRRFIAHYMGLVQKDAEIKRLREREKDTEIERLATEVREWRNKFNLMVEENRDNLADVERLREALTKIVARNVTWGTVEIARAALEGGDDG